MRTNGAGSATALGRLERMLGRGPACFVVRLFRLVIVFFVVYFFLSTWYHFYKGYHFTPFEFCHGTEALFIPSNEREEVSACHWDDAARPLIILYGTIKGTDSRSYSPNDLYNPNYITERALRNWASLSGMQPVIFTEDAGVILRIDELNKEVESDIAANGANATYRNVIHYIQEFEHGTKVKRAPTYRGMLRAIVQAYPAADLFVFANADILFTSSLEKTARGVQRYYDCVVKPNNPLMHGIFVTGRRINVVPPLQWNPWKGKKISPAAHLPEWSAQPLWEREVLALATNNGTRQSPASMDYFIYTRDMLDWNYDLEENDYLIGGIQFDLLWLATAMTMTNRGEVFAVDASRTVLALHMNSQKNMKASTYTLQSFYNTQLTAIAGNEDFLLSNDRVLRMPFITGGKPTALLDRYAYNYQFYPSSHPIYLFRREKCFSRKLDNYKKRKR